MPQIEVDQHFVKSHVVCKVLTVLVHVHLKRHKRNPLVTKCLSKEVENKIHVYETSTNIQATSFVLFMSTIELQVLNQPINIFTCTLGSCELFHVNTIVFIKYSKEKSDTGTYIF